MIEPTVTDAAIVDELDVAAELAALEIDEAGLDRELATVEVSLLPPDLWDPAPGFEQRLEARVAQRLRDRESAWLLASLTGLAWPTLKAVIGDEQGGGA